MEHTNPNYPDHIRGLAEARERLAQVVARYLPDMAEQYDVDDLVNAVMDPSNDAHDDIVGALDESMVEAAQGHPIGISPSERRKLGGSENPFVPDYLLGEGDQKLYAVLRDSNLLNAAVGRVPVETARDLETTNYKVDDEGNPFDPDEPSSWAMFSPAEPVSGELAKAMRIAEAGRNHEWASSIPVQHSTFFGSPYPQHTVLGTPETLYRNTFFNNADGVVGQGLNAILKWEDTSKSASRMPEAGPRHHRSGLEDFAQGAAKWAVNAPGRFMEHADQEGARNDVNRASPIVPDGLSPEDRRTYVEGMKFDESRIAPVDVKTYGESIGKGYAPLTAWAFDMGHSAADPMTAASLGASVAARFPYMLGKSGVLRGLTKAAGQAAMAEGVQEGASPINYLAGAASFPNPFKENIFKGYHVSPEDQQVAQEQVASQRREAESAVERIRASRRWLAPPVTSGQDDYPQQLPP